MKQDSGNEDIVNKLAVGIVSDKHPSSGEHAAKMEESAFLKAANVMGAITGIIFLLEDACITIMTTRLQQKQTVWQL